MLSVNVICSDQSPLWLIKVFSIVVIFLLNDCTCLLGGTAANFTQSYPFVVVVRTRFDATNRSTMCTGILVADDKALVAGNCIRYGKFYPSRMSVRPAGEGRFRVLQFVRSLKRGIGNMNELVMLRFIRKRSTSIVNTNGAKVATDSAFISADPFSSNNETATQATVAGYGLHQLVRRNDRGRKPPEPPQGHVASFQLISEALCHDYSWFFWKTIDFSYKDSICILSDTIETAVCTGDIGAPILVQRSSGLEVLGLVSVRMHRYCRTKHPALGIRLSAYKPWINRWASASTPWVTGSSDGFVHTLYIETEHSDATTSTETVTESETGTTTQSTTPTPALTSMTTTTVTSTNGDEETGGNSFSTSTLLKEETPTTAQMTLETAETRETTTVISTTEAPFTSVGAIEA